MNELFRLRFLKGSRASALDRPFERRVALSFPSLYAMPDIPQRYTKLRYNEAMKKRDEKALRRSCGGHELPRFLFLARTAPVAAKNLGDFRLFGIPVLHRSNLEKPQRVT